MGKDMKRRTREKVKEKRKRGIQFKLKGYNNKFKTGLKKG
jgi:hypothetical protein